jgi:hypothetical protein
VDCAILKKLQQEEEEEQDEEREPTLTLEELMENLESRGPEIHRENQEEQEYPDAEW